MRELQLFILDLAGNQLGELELTDNDDFALKLTKSIASINDLGRRNTSFSLDFKAPQTKNNNRLLAGLKFASHDKEVLGKKPCAIMVDGNQIDRGFVYPFESTMEGEYKLVFKGLNNDWVERLRDVELNELEWRDYDTGLRSEDATDVFSSARINYLSSLNSDTQDLIYPDINRNNGGESTSLRPQLHLRSIILAMFEKAGYTISSDFINSSDNDEALINGWIRGGSSFVYEDLYTNEYTHLGLSVDPNFQMKREEQDILSKSIEYKTTGITARRTDPNTWAPDTMMCNLSNDPNTPSLRTVYRFPNLINDIVLDDGSHFNIATSEYTVPVGGTYTLDFNFNYEWAYYSEKTQYLKFLYWEGQDLSPLSISSNPPSFKWYVVKNNISDTSIDGDILHQTEPYLGGNNISAPNSSIQFSVPSRNRYTFAQGDKISVFLEIVDLASGFYDDGFGNPLNSPSLPYWKLRIQNNSKILISPVADLQEGDIFRINSHIPKGIKCLSLLQDFKTMFNLYFEADPLRKVVVIEPRDQFFKNELVDITDKIDISKAPVLNYLTDYKNEMVFKYKIDSKDKYLEQWNKTNDREYGKYTYLLANNERFEKGQSTLSTSLISATIQGELNSGNIMTSIIKEEYLDKDNEGKPVNSNYGMRVFQLVRGKQFDPSGTERRTTSPEIVTVAIMENFANTPTWGDRKLTFVGERGLVWDYYRKTLANIEDTAVLGLNLKLSLYDFQSWDLRKVFFISEPAEIAGHYITDSIKNFNVTKEGLTNVTLVKFKDYRPSTVEGGSGNVDVITDNVPEPEPILCTVNGAIVNCLDNDLQTMFKI